jgi:hypothetical protein
VDQGCRILYWLVTEVIYVLYESEGLCGRILN